MAAPLRLRLLDASGGSFPDVRVIVKSLEGKGEIFRSLTDSAGSVAQRNLAPGLYRVIATCPYGICKTKVSEFLVHIDPVELELKLDAWSTHGYGDVVTVGSSPKITLRVIDAKGQTLSAAEVL